MNFNPLPQVNKVKKQFWPHSRSHIVIILCFITSSFLDKKASERYFFLSIYSVRLNRRSFPKRILPMKRKKRKRECIQGWLKNITSCRVETDTIMTSFSHSNPYVNWKKVFKCAIKWNSIKEFEQKVLSVKGFKLINKIVD